MLTAILQSVGQHASDRRRIGSLPEGLLWLSLFFALAVAWSWPLAAHFASRIPNDPGDSVLNIWLLWWNAHAVPLTRGWWSPPIFFPMPGALALSEHLAGLAPVTTPLQWAGATPLVAYNAAFMLSFALSGFFAFLLVRRLAEQQGVPAAGCRLAGLCAGLIYGFGPYRAGQLGHLQVLTSQWMPLALLAMHAYLDDGRRRWLALLGAAWLLQALSNGYYLFFFPVLLGLWLVWFVDWRRQARRGAALIGALAAASLPLIGMLLSYADIQQRLGLGRTPGEMVNYSATPSAFLQASELLRFWPGSPAATSEQFLFPGVSGIALVMLAAAAWGIRRRADLPALASRPPLLFYALAAALLWGLAFGPRSDHTSAWLHPYTLLAWLPGFAA
ncbi:MAG: hypothetical protein ABJC51_07460, partial [Acidobacteriota bacterium]